MEEALFLPRLFETAAGFTVAEMGDEEFLGPIAKAAFDLQLHLHQPGVIPPKHANRHGFLRNAIRFPGEMAAEHGENQTHEVSRD
jgi:hypothetical protein